MSGKLFLLTGICSVFLLNMHLGYAVSHVWLLGYLYWWLPHFVISWAWQVICMVTCTGDYHILVYLEYGRLHVGLLALVAIAFVKSWLWLWQVTCMITCTGGYHILLHLENGRLHVWLRALWLWLHGWPLLLPVYFQDSAREDNSKGGHSTDLLPCFHERQLISWLPALFSGDLCFQLHCECETCDGWCQVDRKLSLQ